MKVERLRDASAIKVTTLFGSFERSPALATDDEAKELPLGWLAEFYRDTAGASPRVSQVKTLTPSEVNDVHSRAGVVTGGERGLLSLPSGRMVAVLSLDVDCGLSDLPGLLDDCLDGRPTLEPTDTAAEAIGDTNWRGITSERYQLVHARTRYPDDPSRAIRRLVHRSDQPAWPDSPFSYPEALNRLPSTAAAVGPRLTVLCNHPAPIENVALLSAAQAIASLVTVREIQTRLREIAGDIPRPAAGHRRQQARRRELRTATRELALLALDLSEAVAVPAGFTAAVAPPEVLDYHRAVVASVRVSERATTAGQLLRHLDATVRAGLGPTRPAVWPPLRWFQERSVHQPATSTTTRGA